MRKREADDDLSPISTLGEVAEEARFASLRELLGPVVDTPVDKLGPALRSKLEQKAHEHDLLLSSFFDECDARAAAASSKRANVGVDESAQGE